MKKLILVYSFLLFIIPIVTLFICFKIIALYYPDFQTFPFIDGKASVSMIGRGEKTISIFKSGFLLYACISLFFYLEISKFILSKKIKNKFKISGFLANFFLCVYIFALGKDGDFYEISRRLAIIFYIINMYINHVYLVKLLKLLNNKREMQFSKIYLPVFYTIIFLMTVLIIIGSPWVNPLLNYPDKLKNIIEWNYFLLTIIFYIPLFLLFWKFKEKANEL